MELVNLGDEEYVFNVDKQEHTTTVFHWTCWLDGLSDIIFHSIINRLSREISLKQGFDVELRDSLR